MAQPLSFRWDEAFIGRIDAARGSVPRSRFVREALEAVLSDDTQAASPAPLAEAGGRGGHRTRENASESGAASARGAARPAASPRAPVARARTHHPRCGCPICKPAKGGKR